MEKRVGRSDPTSSYVLPYVKTDGQIAIDLYNLTGRKALPWQEGIMYDILAKNDDGLWVHTRFGYEVPRRNGKGEILVMRELYALAVGEKVLHTAHRTSTSHSAWERLCKIMDMLGIEYDSIRAKGQEYIKLKDGGQIWFRTRTSKGGLGEGFDLLVIDEAQEYQADQESTLKYTVTDSKNPQTIMCGTPPTPISSGTVFKDYRYDVLSGSTENAGWAEWSVDEMSDPEDRDLWYETNPSLGWTLTERAIADEVGKADDKVVDFNIQRLGLWISYNQKSVISTNEWEAIQLSSLPSMTGKMDAGIKYGKDGTVSLSIAVRTSDNRIFCETIGCRSARDGDLWIIDFLRKAQTNKIVVDGSSGQKNLIESLAPLRIRNVITPTVSEIIAANAAFENAIVGKTICHMDQPSVTQVITNCEKRAIGTNGGFGFKSIKDEADITIMDSLILATWAISEFKEKQAQRVRY